MPLPANVKQIDTQWNVRCIDNGISVYKQLYENIGFYEWGLGNLER